MNARLVAALALPLLAATLGAMYRALRDNNVETQLWVYPLAGHMPADPVHVVDYYTRWTNWIRSHFT